VKDWVGGLDGLKIQSEKWEGSGGEARRVKDLE
jgi:hypothetical protein